MHARSESADREPDATARPRLIRELGLAAESVDEEESGDEKALDAIVVSALLAVVFAALRLPRPVPARMYIPSGAAAHVTAPGSGPAGPARTAAAQTALARSGAGR